MQKRMAGGILVALLAGGASPALADCCSDFLGCVATVVTYGVSCEVQLVIDTVKSLANEISNLINTVTGSAQAAVNAAKQSVNDTYNSMLLQTQQGSADLATAAGQAAGVVKAELSPRITGKVAGTQNSNLLGAADSQNASPYDRQSSPVVHAGTPQGPGAGLMAAPLNAAVAHVAPTTGGSAAPGSPTQAQSQLAANAASSVATVASQRGAPMAYADIFRGAQQAVDALKQTGDADAAKVNGHLTSAMNSEGAGLASADQIISNIINAPLNGMLSYLNGLLSDPTKIIDPSPAVDDMINATNKSLDYNLDEVVQTIERGPQANFDAAQPSYDALAGSADQAQAIAAAMQRLYQQRTPGAYDALAALVPRDLNALQASRATRTLSSTGNTPRRLTYAQLRSPILAKRTQAMVQVKARTQQAKTVLARFAMQRLKARTPELPAVLQAYQNTASQKLNGYFSGRTPAQIAQQRDQLIAQAHTRFANDPKTGNAVIAYLNSDASKRSNGALAAAPASAMPADLPKNAVVTSTPPTTAPTAAGQSAPVAWGTAGAWRPPVTAAPAPYPAVTPVPGTVVPGTAAPAGSLIRPAGGFKTVQPVAPRPAPSSLGSN